MGSSWACVPAAMAGGLAPLEDVPAAPAAGLEASQAVLVALEGVPEAWEDFPGALGAL